MTVIAQFCETPDGCDCTPPKVAEYEVEIPAGNFSKKIQIEGTKPFKVKNISVDDWCVVTFNDGIQLDGSLDSGGGKQVIEVENDCGTAVVVIDISVLVECEGEIKKDIPIKDGVVGETIQVPGGEIVSASIGTATATVYGTDLIIKGNATPGNYEIKFNDDCNTVVKGKFYECIVPKLLSTSGLADFERQTPASFSWLIAGNSIKTKNPVVPAGLSVTTTENNGQTTVTVSGTPTQNTGNGTMSVVAFNDCGQITLTQKYTQAACKGVRVTGEEGSANFELGKPGSYCKILEGYEPMEIVSFADVPKGMTPTIEKIGPNKYKLCIVGTPIEDACAETETEVNCKCSKVTVRNECGDTEVELCSSTYVIQKPTYCVGLVKITEDNSGLTKQVTIEVMGVMPNSKITIGNADKTEATADGSGYINVVVEPTVSDGCITVSHETCGLVIANKATNVYCVSSGGGA